MNLWFYSLWLFVFISATFTNVCVWLAVWIQARRIMLLVLSETLPTWERFAPAVGN